MLLTEYPEAACLTLAPDPIQAAHMPQSVAWSTASQAWKRASSMLLPVPRPPLSTHD